MLDDVRDYEKKIKRLDSRLSEIRDEKYIYDPPQKSKTQPAKMNNEQEDYEDSYGNLKSTIENQMKNEKFETQSEREIFSKVSNDLLDQDPEIQVLAAAELGKMAHPGAIPILMAATKLNQPELTNEIINALIKFNDDRAVLIFKEEMANSRFSVRIGCLRGIYKLAEDHEIVTIFSDALRDKHSEVRRTAATFLGWRDKSDIVPALVQCLKDENERVRRATVDALSNIKDPASVLPMIKVLADEKLDIRERAYGAIRLITGEKIDFDLHLTGSKLKEEIEKLRDWWQEFRLEKKKAELSADDFDSLEEEMEDTPDLYEADEDTDISETLNSPESIKLLDTSEKSEDTEDSKEAIMKEVIEAEDTDDDITSGDETLEEDTVQQDIKEDMEIKDEDSEEQTTEDDEISEEVSGKEIVSEEVPSEETESEEISEEKPQAEVVSDESDENEIPEDESITEEVTPIEKDAEETSEEDSNIEESPVEKSAEESLEDESSTDEIPDEAPETTNPTENEIGEKEEGSDDNSRIEDSNPEDSDENR